MIKCKSPYEVELIYKAGQILARTLNLVSEKVLPDIRTEYLEEIAIKYIRENGASAAFKGYRGFPANICASVNEEVVHGIPSKRTLKEGDIVSIDIGVCYKKYYADASITCGVGKISREAQKLIDVTKQSLYLAISKIRDSVELSRISETIQNLVESNGFSVVRDLVGHGIGSLIHEEPQIPNYVDPTALKKEEDIILKEGMVLAIEPMVNQGTWEVETLPNSWTVVTKDRKLSAHFEHTVLVEKYRGKILTFANN